VGKARADFFFYHSTAIPAKTKANLLIISTPLLTSITPCRYSADINFKMYVRRLVGSFVAELTVTIAF